MIGIAKLKRFPNWYGRNRAVLFGRRVLRLKTPKALISFTFDDFPRSAYLVGGAILNKYGAKGTYYASLGLMGKEHASSSIVSLEELRELVNDGHELGCHTYDHIDAWEGDPESFERSILKNQVTLKQILPQVVFKTLSYPRKEPHPRIKRIAEKYFKCCRGGGQTFNIGKVDLNLLRSCFIDWKNRENLSLLKELIDKNKEEKGWLIFSTHDLCDNPSPFGCRPGYFEEIVRHAVNSGASVLPIYEAFLSIHTG